MVAMLIIVGLVIGRIVAYIRIGKCLEARRERLKDKAQYKEMMRGENSKWDSMMRSARRSSGAWGRAARGPWAGGRVQSASLMELEALPTTQGAGSPPSRGRGPALTRAEIQVLESQTRKNVETNRVQREPAVRPRVNLESI